MTGVRAGVMNLALYLIPGGSLIAIFVLGLLGAANPDACMKWVMEGESPFTEQRPTPWISDSLKPLLPEGVQAPLSTRDASHPCAPLGPGITKILWFGGGLLLVAGGGFALYKQYKGST